MTAMPGRSHAGSLPPLSDEGRALAERLRGHVAVLARSERNADLETAARYIESAFGSSESQYFESGGRKVRNIQTTKPSVIVVGAHYDTVPGSPGADDNASAVAVLIELAAMQLPVRFVAFANEEMPYFLGPEMGSFVSAKRSRERGEDIRAMFSLEMLGYYRDIPGIQQYPAPLGLFYPDRADFIAFVGDLAMRVIDNGSIWGEPSDRAKALKVLRRAVELGVNFFDTAESYGPHTDEILIAEALHPYPKGFVIGTKCGVARPSASRWDADGRPEKLKKDLEGSLKRLRLERIDLYQLHTVDPKVPLEVSLR